jgi:hypothetical protein
MFMIVANFLLALASRVLVIRPEEVVIWRKNGRLPSCFNRQWKMANGQWEMANGLSIDH